MKIKKEQKNLVKLKKAYFYSKFLKKKKDKNCSMKLFLIIQYGRKLHLKFQNFNFLNIKIIRSKMHEKINFNNIYFFIFKTVPSIINQVFGKIIIK